MGSVIRNNVKAERARRGWSMEQVANEAGLTFAQVRRIEDTDDAKISEVEALATAFNIAPAVLVGWLTITRKEAI